MSSTCGPNYLKKVTKKSSFYLTPDLKEDWEHLGSRLLSVWRCSVAWPPWSRWWSWGSRGAWLIGLCVCTCWQEDIMFLFFSPLFFFFFALTSQPWLTWFVVAPRSEGGSWIMSSYSLKGGPRLVDYRIALTDQRELWLLSNSLHKKR